jgi:hypothetical protein
MIPTINIRQEKHLTIPFPINLSTYNQTLAMIIITNTRQGRNELKEIRLYFPAAAETGQM